jgi:hypothetical protein
MRHYLLATSISAHALRVRQAAATAALVALGGLAQAGAARCLRAAAIAVDLTAVAAAANDDLRPAMGAHKEAARGRHRQSPRYAETASTGWGEPCHTGPARAPLARVGHDIGMNLAVWTGVVPVSFRR